MRSPGGFDGSIIQLRKALGKKQVSPETVEAILSQTFEITGLYPLQEQKGVFQAMIGVYCEHYSSFSELHGIQSTYVKALEAKSRFGSPPPVDCLRRTLMGEIDSVEESEHLGYRRPPSLDRFPKDLVEREERRATRHQLD